MAGALIGEFSVSAYSVPTESPESDGTAEWSETTAIIVQLRSAGTTGLGYSYGSSAAATLLSGELHLNVIGKDVLDGPAIRASLIGAVRNAGRGGRSSLPSGCYRRHQSREVFSLDLD